MAGARPPEGGRNAVAGRHGVQPLGAVDVEVEERVEEVEARDPESDGAAERPGLPRKRVRDRGPGTERREPVHGAEPEVRERAPALQIRVEHEARDRDRPEPVDDRRELEDGDEEDGQRKDAEEDDLRRREGAARELPSRRARVPGVDARVDEPVERHREAPGSEHGHGDPEKVVRARDPVDREERADVGERKREDRVLDLHQRGEEPRVAERCLGHVWRCSVVSAANSLTAWPTAGASTAQPSRHAPGEPGRLTTSVEPTMPAAPRESIPCGVLAIGVRPHGLGDPRRAALDDLGGRLRRHIARTEPGAPGREHERARLGQLAKSRGDLVAVVGNRPALDLPPVLGESPASRSPLSSSRSPAETPSETVSTAALTPSSSRGA